MPLDIKVEAENLKRMYEEKSEPYHRVLLVGDTGSGKTRFLETCPRPIHTDSFDPAGTKTIEKGIKEGWILADTRYEFEDPTDPEAFELWDKEFHRRKEGGYFEQIGTYCLDPLTTWLDSIMNIVLKGLQRKADRGASGKSGAALDTKYLRIPQENDWPIQMNIVWNALKSILTLPCHVVVTGHLEDKKNKQGLVISKGLYATGRLALRIPRLFEEIYHLKVEDSSKGPVYLLLTEPEDGVYARTRIGRDTFEFREKPDFMYLLQKAGYNPMHKDMPWIEKK